MQFWFIYTARTLWDFFVEIENKVKLSVKQLSSQSIKAMEAGHTFRRVVELLSGEWWSRQLGHIFVHADLSVLQGDRSSAAELR